MGEGKLCNNTYIERLAACPTSEKLKTPASILG